MKVGHSSEVAGVVHADLLNIYVFFKVIMEFLIPFNWYWK